MSKNILIIGATSAIARATARIYAQAGGNKLFLVARNEVQLDRNGADLQVRGAASVHTETLDLNQFEQHGPLIDKVFDVMGRVDIVLIAHGTLPDQNECAADVKKTLAELNTNAISIISLLTHLANRMEQQRFGTIAVISSVAGDRGRQSNYIYGAAKGMVSVFMQGLRNRLFKSGVNVLTIKPGFVDTPMTKEFDKGLLWVKPDAIARGIIKAINKRKGEVYLPGFWALIMFIIRSIPEMIFKRLSL
ncbi:MAG: SDR family oxidoreductase [Gammaproteobacteria bacterium]|nr:SDR family oxidoreductase [Gammaproteobacteria bacterium]